MGNATPFARVHLPIPRLSAPEVLDPYPAEPASQALEPIPPEVLARLREDPWALQALDPELRVRPEVLRAAIESGHPQALEAIGAFVPPEVLRRPEIYSWLKEYRASLLPSRVFFFQAAVGLGLAEGEAIRSIGGELGLGGTRLAVKGFYHRLLSGNGSGGAGDADRLGFETLGLFYPAKRISMRERQSTIALGLPLAAHFDDSGRVKEIGLSLGYYLARGEDLATPIWGVEARILAERGNFSAGPSATLELQMPVWSALAGLERLGGLLRRP